MDGEIVTVFGVQRSPWGFILFTGSIIAFGFTFLSVIGLVCIWTTRVRLHWFARAIVLYCVIASPSSIGGSDLLLAAMTQSACFFGVLGIVRCRETRIHLRFFLGDLLLAMTLFAMLVALLVAMPHAMWSSWKYLIPCGITFGFASLLAYRMDCLHATGWQQFGTAILFPPSAMMIASLSLVRSYRSRRLFGRPHGLRHDPRSVIAQCGSHLLEAVFILSLLVVSLLLLPVGAGKAVVSEADNPILQAAARFPGTIPTPDKASRDQLGTFVAKHQTVLKDVTHIAEHRRLTLPPPTAYDSRMRIDAMRKLRDAFTAKIRFDQSEGRVFDAAQTCIDMMRVGKAMALGGTLFDSLNGRHLEATGITLLNAIADQLDQTQCRTIASDLETIEEGCEQVETIIKRDAVWMSYPFSWRGAVFFRVLSATDNLPESTMNVYPIFRDHRAAMHSLTVRLRARSTPLAGTDESPE